MAPCHLLGKLLFAFDFTFRIFLLSFLILLYIVSLGLLLLAFRFSLFVVRFALIAVRFFVNCFFNYVFGVTRFALFSLLPFASSFCFACR